MVSKFPRRGEVYWVNLEPTIGSETQKTRPGLVISNDIGNEMSDVVIIAPITSKTKNVYPFEVLLLVNNKQGKAMINQCRAIDKSRLGKKMCSISLEEMYEVEEAIKIVFAID
jgi:mRNA interferase MazF